MSSQPCSPAWAIFERMIGSTDDAHEFTAVQPIQFAARTIVDDNVPRATVVMRVHRLLALGALHSSSKPLRIGRSGNVKGSGLLRSKILHQQDEDWHRNQASAAAGAVESSVVIDNSVVQWHGAEGTGKVGNLSHKTDAVLVFMWDL